MFALSAGLLPLTGCVFAQGRRYDQFTPPRPWRTRALERHMETGLKLRGRYPDTVNVKMVENMKCCLARELIRRTFDRNRDGQFDA
ncbi:MAG: hypothetical protein J2P21_21285 [Chloracidobacterium sp.]|nr:hypothetical protein [Chloracidobacterium sp.]